MSWMKRCSSLCDGSGGWYRVWLKRRLSCLTELVQATVCVGGGATVSEVVQATVCVGGGVTVSDWSGAGYRMWWRWCNCVWLKWWRLPCVMEMVQLCLTEVVQATVCDGGGAAVSDWSGAGCRVWRMLWFFAAGCQMLLLRLWCTAVDMTEIWQWKGGKKCLILSNKTCLFSSLIRMLFEISSKTVQSDFFNTCMNSQILLSLLPKSDWGYWHYYKRPGPNFM